MGVSFKSLLTAGLVFVGAMAVQPVPAEAQPRWGPYYRGGYGYAPRAYYGPRVYRGYRYGYYRRPYYGGAVAAGIVGGLALGAIAVAAANPYHGPGYYAPAYYPPPRCVFERRRVVNPYGRVVVRRIRVCY